MRQPKSDQRPDSTLLLTHPFFVISTEEARIRLMESIISDRDVLSLFNGSELEKWWASVNDNLRNELENDSFSEFRDLIDKVITKRPHSFDLFKAFIGKLK